MSDTLLPDDPLLCLLGHGYGELTEDTDGTTLVLTVEARQHERLPDLVARVEALARPGDLRRYIVRGGRIVHIHLIRRQAKAPV